MIQNSFQSFKNNNTTIRIILKQIGSLLMVLGIIIAVPAFVSLICFEWYSLLGFLLSGFFSFGLGYLLHYAFRNAADPFFNHAMIIAASGWLVLTFVGGLPLFVISHLTPRQVMQSFVPLGADYPSSLLYFRNLLHCFFESMSGYTTTGLTMAVHEPSVGKGILFYRSFSQWIGGAGFIVLSLSVLKMGSGKSVQLLYRSESTGMKLRPRVRETAKAIWQSYLYITLIIIVYLIIGTFLILPDYPIADNIFDSVNHAMAGISSGGFSTLDDSIAGYKSPLMDYLYLLPMVLGSFSLPLYYRIFYQGKFNEMWTDIQARSLIICFIFGGLILSLLLFDTGIVPNPFREGIFQFISGMSTTGWQTSVISNWDTRSIVFIVFAAMFIGGSWGGTVGGIKIVRARLIQVVLGAHINRALLSENTVKIVKFDRKLMMPEEMNREFANAASFSFMFLLILLLSTFVSTYFIPDNYSFADALFEATAAQSTAGLTVGITDPSMNPMVELIYIFQMWVGRLEIIPALALFRVLFFGANPGRI